MLPFIRSDLASLNAYTPHTEASLPSPLDQLDTNENPYDLPPHLKEKQAWTYQSIIRSNRYPDGGHLALKRAIAEYANESAATNWIEPHHISVGNGSDELLRSLLIATCLNGEGSILVANPTFSMYGILAQTLGIPVHTISRSPATFEMDLSAAQTAIAAPHSPPIRVIFVVHPNSPTANALTPAEMAWLRSVPANILVVIDEAYFEFSQTSLVSELPNHPNWMILRTFSKAFRLAAHRVGYAIAHPDMIAILEKVRLPYNLPSFSLAAALTALAHRSDLLAVIPEILEQRQRLADELGAIAVLQTWPSHGNFIYARLKPDISDRPDDILAQVVTTLKSQGTLIRHTGGGLRLTIGSPDENIRLVDRLKAALTAIG